MREGGCPVGCPVIHDAGLRTAVSSRKTERVLWPAVSRKSQRAASVSAEPHVQADLCSV